MTPPPFVYPNLPLRPPGRMMRTLSAVLPGVRRTMASVAPFAAGWAEHNARAAAGTGPLWVVLGDSMAQGIGATSYDRGWPGQLAHRLDPAYRLVNLSHHGARVRDAIDRQWAAAAALGPIDLVTVVIGANDVVRRESRAALPDAFAELIDVLPDRAVIANLPNPVREARVVDDLLRRAADERGTVRVDLRVPATTRWRGKLAADHFHPNDRGYAAIAGVLADAIHRQVPPLPHTPAGTQAGLTGTD